MTVTTSAPSTGEFAERTEPYRRELLAHCYRMLGSVDEAEDLVQETYLRAWRAYERFEGRSSVRTWLYQIATNACLTALRHGSRRVLPSGLGAPGDDPHGEIEMAGPGVAWLQPIPDALVTPESADPAVAAVSRESVRLALVACLQHLLPKQRAVLILRDVLGFPAADVARMLEMTTPAVKSTLQRARARLAEVTPADAGVEPTEPEQRALLEGYIAAFENADGAAFERLLRKDATLEFPPAATWFAGKVTCVPYLSIAVEEPGAWRMVPVRANGQPAAAAYHRGEDGVLRAFGVAVLTTAADGIAGIVAFGDLTLFDRFGLPESMAGAAR